VDDKSFTRPISSGKENNLTRLTLPDQGETITDFSSVQRFLHDKGIIFEHWNLEQDLPVEADSDAVLKAYGHFLKPFMKKGGYATADVICVDQSTPNLLAIRNKFLAEHTHDEDEIRFFVEGSGLFWFNLDGTVFSVLCSKGDLLGVPANTKHWFDLGPKAYVKAIRIFTDQAGWTPNYTDSGIDRRYNPRYSE
jgi:1,2-dihydroxy-3-keto-5-methylthiopentene dioxygenase